VGININIFKKYDHVFMKSSTFDCMIEKMVEVEEKVIEEKQKEEE